LLIDQESLATTLGPNSNAFIWPRRKAGSDDEIDEDAPVESFLNQRLMRIGVFFSYFGLLTPQYFYCVGDDHADLDLSDAGSVTSSEDEDEDDKDDILPSHMSMSSSTTSLTSAAASASAASAAISAGEQAAEHEFQSEVRQSLARAFAEGHSLDNAAVELKTLRMASNVPIRKVREAVVAGVVERIPIEKSDPARQRSEIQRWIGRWGALINAIGGIDGVETVMILQVRSCSHFISIDLELNACEYQVPLRSVGALSAVWSYLGGAVSDGRCRGG
jgi:translation initiation factor eIF-2B subunit epsilon